MVNTHKNKLNELGVYKFTNENLGVVQEKLCSSNLTNDEFLEKLSEDKVFGKMKIMSSENRIILHTKISWKSCGEIISINTRRISDELYEYIIKSEPNLKTTIIDYGTNYANVKRITSVLGYCA